MAPGRALGQAVAAAVRAHSGAGLAHRAGDGGQVAGFLLSQASAGLVAGGLPGGAVLTDLSWHRLADLGPAGTCGSWAIRTCPLPSRPCGR